MFRSLKVTEGLSWEQTRCRWALEGSKAPFATSFLVLPCFAPGSELLVLWGHCGSQSWVSSSGTPTCRARHKPNASYSGCPAGAQCSSSGLGYTSQPERRACADFVKRMAVGVSLRAIKLSFGQVSTRVCLSGGRSWFTGSCPDGWEVCVSCLLGGSGARY